jgi:hypothetical protein
LRVALDIVERRVEAFVHERGDEELYESLAAHLIDSTLPVGSYFLVPPPQ